jgi:hypothetical protein
MSEALEVAREQEVSWRAALGAPGEPTLRIFWFLSPQVFVFVLYYWRDAAYFGRDNPGYDPFEAAACWAALTWVAWAAVCVGEVVVRRQRRIAMREADPAAIAAQTPAPHGLAAWASLIAEAPVDLVKVTWTGWFAAMAMFGLVFPREIGMSLKCALVCLCVTAALRWPLGRIHAAREHRARLAALAARLEREGAHGLEAGDPRRIAIAQRFWREQQARAASALQQRLERPIQLAPYDPRHEWLIGVGVFVVLLGVAALTVFYGTSRWIGLLWVLGLLLTALIVLLCCAGAVVWGVERLLLGQRQRAQRRICTEERRRIATMAELAGGLTLAEYVADDALAGALSGDGARGGALSGVEP